MNTMTALTASTFNASPTKVIQVKNTMSRLDWSWSLLFAIALIDVVFRYFGVSLHLSVIQQPWIIITVLFFLVFIFDLSSLKALNSRVLLAYGGFILSLLVGYFTIKIPTAFISTMEVPFSILPTDVLKMTLAFLIGAIWISRPNIDAKFVTNIFLILTAFHASVCVIALLKIYPSAFPIIDMPYFKNGHKVSRPEITTDQTRQVLYLFMCLCVVFIQRSLIKKSIALLITIAIVFILAKVQSRSASLLFSFFFVVAFGLAIRYKKTSIAALIVGMVLAVILVIIKWEFILDSLSDLIWRFQQVDSTYGGRGLSNLYLIEKLYDFNYWVPMGYNDFFKKYGQAPHSFITMIYLNSGLIGFICYLLVAIPPLFILSKKVLLGNATQKEQIGFFCYLNAFSLSLTQPVIHHQIFWLLFGLGIGSISKEMRQPVAVMRKDLLQSARWSK